MNTIKIITLSITIMGLNFLSGWAENYNWIPIYEGVDYLLHNQGLEETKVRIHAIRINLRAPDISLFTTAPITKDSFFTAAKKPSTFLIENKAQVVINGLAYYPATLSEEGSEKLLESMAISNGIWYSPIGAEDACMIELKDGRVKIIRTEQLTEFEGQIKNGIGGWTARGPSALIVNKGQVNPNLIIDELDARTAIGISEDESTLFMVVAEGNPRHGDFFYKDQISEGIYLKDLASFMVNLGCYYAINLDGGRASTMVIEDNEGKPLVLNIPSDYGDEREQAVGSHTGVHAKPLDSVLGMSNIRKLKQEVDHLIAFRGTLRAKGITNSLHYVNETLNYNELTQYEFDQFTHQYNHLLDSCEENMEIDFLRLSDLKFIGSKPSGKSKGGVYKDKQGVVWFVKKGQKPATEYIASKILNLFLGDRTALIKLVEASSGDWGLTAARQMSNFKSKEQVDKLLKQV